MTDVVKKVLIPWRFRKTGKLWCGGERETRVPRVTIGWLLPVGDILSNLPVFQDVNSNKKEVFQSSWSNKSEIAIYKNGKS